MTATTNAYSPYRPTAASRHPVAGPAKLRLVAMFTGIALSFSTTQTNAGPLCKPSFTIIEARTSEAQNLQKSWTANLAVDASRCASKSGSFEIQFTRLKDEAPDLQFTERFTWRPGQTRVSLDFWWDESVSSYRVSNIAACQCRD